MRDKKVYKVKLMDGRLILLSPDVEIGDKVYQHKYNHEVGIVAGFKDNSKSIFYFEGKEPILKNYHSTGNWGKIMNQISPNATWVKEGDEFSEEEISTSAFEKTTDIRPNQPYVFIKGSCGHFH